jgi:hypothetical protein
MGPREYFFSAITQSISSSGGYLFRAFVVGCGEFTGGLLGGYFAGSYSRSFGVGVGEAGFLSGGFAVGRARTLHLSGGRGVIGVFTE